MDTSYDISLKKDEKLKEKIQIDKQFTDLKQEIITIQYEIAKLRLQQKELEGKLNQAEFNVKKVNTEIKLLDSSFWSAKQSGI